MDSRRLPLTRIATRSDLSPQAGCVWLAVTSSRSQGIPYRNWAKQVSLDEVPRQPIEYDHLEPAPSSAKRQRR